MSIPSSVSKYCLQVLSPATFALNRFQVLKIWRVSILMCLVRRPKLKEITLEFRLKLPLTTLHTFFLQNTPSAILTRFKALNALIKHSWKFQIDRIDIAREIYKREHTCGRTRPILSCQISLSYQPFSEKRSIFGKIAP